MQPYQIIPLDSAIPGMTLADNLLGSHGEIMLPSGAVLSETMISSLKRHSVAEISILKNIDPIEQEQNNRLMLEQKMQRADKLFKTHEQNRLNQELKNYLIHHLTSGKS
jgi:hypothetical protein